MYDLNLFHHDVVEQPTWSPKVNSNEFTPNAPMKPTPDIFVFDNVLPPTSCNTLIEQFSTQEVYPVGIDGYSNSVNTIGSYRAMGWSPALCEGMQRVLKHLPKTLKYEDSFLTGETFETVCNQFQEEVGYEYKLLGSTPWMRFMKYPSGGMHVPHYDASFHQPSEKYRTLFSWILYLTDCDPIQGGRLQFVDDTFRNSDEGGDYNFSDWRRMAENYEIIMSVRPQVGRMVVFPHWHCHQVEQFTGTDTNPMRCIIRGDCAYGY